MVFEYEGLIVEYQEIRLATLGAGAYDDDLICEISQSPLNYCQGYTALSYVWGDQTQTRPLLLTSDLDGGTSNAKTLAITVSLDTALRAMRKLRGRRVFWIDAICINQDDLAERSSQVTLMQQIYRNASMTIIFFGPETQFSSVGMSTIREITTTIDPSLLPTFEMSLILSGPEEARTSDHPLTPHMKKENALKALAEFFTLPWWTRVWVIQELAVSKNSFFIWGKSTLPWECAARIHMMVKEYVQFVRDTSQYKELDSWKEIEDGTERALAIIATHQQFIRSIPRPLFNLLQDSWFCDATDPRDKIYALLSLATDGHGETIVPDYSAEVGSVFGSVVKNLMTRSGNLDVLALCSGPGARRVEGLATWAPDWTSEGINAKWKEGFHTFALFRVENLAARMKTSRPQAESLFCASGEPNDISRVEFSDDFKELRLTGILLDKVRVLSDVRPYRFKFIEVANAWGPFGDSLGKVYPNGELATEAFEKTLHADQFPPLNFNVRDSAEVLTCSSTVTSGQRFMLTQLGLMGLAVMEAQVGDLICVLKGTRTPILLREEGDNFLMVGESYGKFILGYPLFVRLTNYALVHGIMRGEVFNGWAKGAYEERVFRIL